MVNLSILMIEDSADDAFLAKSALQKYGFSVDYKRVDTSEALKAALGSASWDIVLSDYNLPLFDGLKALIIVRNFSQEIPFIIVSGAIGEEKAVMMMKAGATDYVKKDQLQRLPAVIERCLKDVEVKRDNRESRVLLLRSQEQLSNALEMARLGHWEYDILEDSFTFNDQFYSIFKTQAASAGGYSMDSKTYARLFVHPEDVRKVKAESLKAINALDPHYTSQFEHRTVFPDGSVGILMIRFSVVKDEKGRTTRVYGVVQDITDLLAKQRKLKENEDKYQTVFENFLDAILLARPDGTILDANPAACRMFNYTREEILRGGRSLLFDARDPRLHQALKTREDTGFTFAEITMLRSGGIAFPAEISSAVFMDSQGKPETSIIIRDITDRKNAEKVMRERDSLFKKLSANVPGMIYQCVRRQDGSYCLPFATSAIRELFGCREDEVVSDWAPLVSAIVHEDRDLFVKSYERSAETMSLRQIEYRVHLPGKAVRWILGRATPELQPDGSIIWHGFATDITERKRAEEELRKNERRLEGMLELTQFKTESSKEFLDFALEEALCLTDSAIGFIFFYDEPTRNFKLGTWSRSVMAACAEHATSISTNLAEAGFWAEAVRQRRPVIDNDFSSPSAAKRGYPSSHAPIRKFLTVPVIRNEHIVAVAAVANKTEDYDSSDIRQFSILMETVWSITEENRSSKALSLSEQKFRGIFENAQEGIFQSSPDGRYLAANDAMANILGYDSPEDLMSTVTDIPHQVYMRPEDRIKMLGKVEEFGSVQSYESMYRRKDGSPLWASVSIHPVFDEKGALLHFQGFLVDVTERKNSLEKLRRALKETVFAISASVEAKDPYTAGHQRRVADLAVAIAAEMGLSNDQKEGLRLAASIHDLGKLSIPTEILTKPKKLLPLEFSLIKVHSQAGYDILRDIDFPWPIARIVLEHHERIDGSGYPQGLKGESLLIESKILAVADVVESMASDRPYRPSLGIDAALEEIEKRKGILYDATVADSCLRLFRDKEFVLT